jgi:hypothetical protein
MDGTRLGLSRRGDSKSQHSDKKDRYAEDFGQDSLFHGWLAASNRQPSPEEFLGPVCAVTRGNL